MDITLNGLNEHDKTDGLQMVQEELDDVRNHLSSVSGHVTDIRRIISGHTDRLTSLQNNFQKDQSTNQVHERLESKLSELERNVFELQSNVSVLFSLRENFGFSDLTDIRTDISSAVSGINQLAQEAQALQNRISELEEQQETGSVSPEIQELQIDLQVLRSDMNSCFDQMNQLSYVVGDDNSNDDTVPLLEKIENLKINFRNMQTELSEWRNAKSIGEDLGQRLNALGADVTGIVNNTASVVELDAVRNNVQTLTRSVTMLQQRLQSNSGNSEISAIKTNLAAIEANCNQLSVQLGNKVAKEEITRLKSNLSEMVVHLAGVEAVLTQMKESHDNTVQYTEELSNQISQMENLRQDVSLMQVHMDQMSQDISTRATGTDVSNIWASVSELRAEVSHLQGEHNLVTSEVKTINQRMNTLRQGMEDNSEYINTLMQSAEDSSQYINNMATKVELQSMEAALRHNISDSLSQTRENLTSIRQRLLTLNNEVDSMGQNHRNMISDFLNLRQEFDDLRQQKQEHQTGSDVIKQQENVKRRDVTFHKEHE